MLPCPSYPFSSLLDVYFVYIFFCDFSSEKFQYFIPQAIRCVCMCLRHSNEWVRLFWYTVTRKNGTKSEKERERERIFWYKCYLESASLSPFVEQHIHNVCDADTSCAHNVNQTHFIKSYTICAECCTLRNCPVQYAPCVYHPKWTNAIEKRAKNSNNNKN